MSKEYSLNRRNSTISAISLLVAAYGVYVLAETLSELLIKRHMRFNRSIADFRFDLSILLGLSVIYLANLLRRRKRTAWTVSVVAYIFYLGVGVSLFFSNVHYYSHTHHILMPVLRFFVFPIIILALLYIYKDEFIVKSDIKGFRNSLSFIVIILFVAIVYGVSGFLLMDKSDFHQEIGFGSALHYTIDQFNITTNRPLHPYTKRAALFLDSLTFVSIVSLAYAALSLFQPIRQRFQDQSYAREQVEELLRKYGGEAEEFFKIWPQDKQYFFDYQGESVIAYHAYRGVALCVGDPIGKADNFNKLIEGFLSLCFSNDWDPAFIHTSDKYLNLYEKYGLTAQLLGQEAVVDIDKFIEELLPAKYFRQICNKFNKQGYTVEWLKPPHHQAILDRTKQISDEWLSKGGRAERGFALGYYTPEYMQLCDLLVARDAAGTIQAFINIIPANWDKQEATYDLIRQSDKALGNIVDYLIINVITELKAQGYSRFNMGLSPLSGLDNETVEKKSLVDNVLKFAYANGDPFFSFSGLYKFKTKYEPVWQNKYVIYKGGVPGFSKTMAALTRLMSKTVKLK